MTRANEDEGIDTESRVCFNGGMSKTTTSTHEQFIHGVREIVLANADLKPEQVARIQATKLVYGLGTGSYRGVTWYNAWAGTDEPCDVVEIAATAEESWVQLAGTVIHELGHVLAGPTAGHDVAWKEQAKDLGFSKRPAAAGQVYSLAMFKPAIRTAVARLAGTLADGNPSFHWGTAAVARVTAVRPCAAGHGTKGGTSRGKGSGSRLRLWECECDRPVKVRIASDDFQAHCDRCGEAFHRA